MCKSFLSGLLGGGAKGATPAKAPDEVRESDAAVNLETDTVANPDAAGRDASGRIKLGTSKRDRQNVAGLSI